MFPTVQAEGQPGSRLEGDVVVGESEGGGLVVRCTMLSGLLRDDVGKSVSRCISGESLGRLAPS